MTILLSEELVTRLALEMFLDPRGLRLVQSNDIVLLAHLVTVDGAESGSETAHGRDAEDRAVLDAVVGFLREGRAQGAVDDAGAAVGYNQRVRTHEKGKKGGNGLGVYDEGTGRY